MHAVGGWVAVAVVMASIPPRKSGSTYCGVSCRSVCLFGGVMTPRSYAHSLSPVPRGTQPATSQPASQPHAVPPPRATEQYKTQPELSKVERAAVRWPKMGPLSRPSYSSCHPIRSIDRPSEREFSPLILAPLRAGKGQNLSTKIRGEVTLKSHLPTCLFRVNDATL